MTVSFNCPHCGRGMSLRDDYAGRSVACSGCNRTVTVPSAVDPATTSSTPPARSTKPIVAMPTPKGGRGSAELFEVNTAPNGRITLSIRGRPVRLEIGVETKVAVPHDPIIERIIQTICQSWRDTSADGIQQADVQLTVNHFELGSDDERQWSYGTLGNSIVGLLATGTVNGSNLEEEFTATRRYGLFGGSSEQMVGSCLDECVACALSAIHRVAGVPESGFSGRWRLIQIFAWVATIATLAGYLAVTLQHMQPPGKQMIEIRDPQWRRNFLIVGAVLAGVGVYFSIFMTALAVAPRRFLTADPRGMRVMARVGMRSVTAMRVVAAIVAMTGPVLIACAISIYRNPRFFT